VGDSASVIALRPEGRRPAELHFRRPGRLPAVSKAPAGRRPWPTGHPGSALSVGVWADDRRPGGATSRRASPNGQNVRVGVVRDGVNVGRGAT